MNKFKLILAVLIVSAFSALASYIGPVTICDVAHAQGYALSPRGVFEYYQFIPWPPVRGWYDLQISFDGGVTWGNIQHYHVTSKETVSNEEEVWYLPDPNYPPVEYRWFN